MSDLPMIQMHIRRAARASVRVNVASAGFGLIELMIGVLIGTVLLLGLTQVFSMSRNTYQTSTGLARAQENSRFAMDFLQRDLRMAGNTGCVNDVSHFQSSPPAFFSHFLTAADRGITPLPWINAPYGLQFNLPIQGYDATGSAPNQALSIAANTDPLPAAALGAVTDWSPNLPASLITAAGPVKGSDVIVLRFFDSNSIPVTAINLASNPVTITVPVAYAGQVVAGKLYGLADCNKASVFQATTGANGAGVFTVDKAVLPNKSDFLGGEYYVPRVLQVYPLRTVAYFIGKGAGGGPVLMRQDLSNGAAADELVEGIENLQLLYGYDSNGAGPDGAVDTYWTAAQVATTGAAQFGGDATAAWRRIGTVRVGFISRSVDYAAANKAIVAVPNVLGVTVTLPPADGRVRQVYASTIALRNRLFGN